MDRNTMQFGGCDLWLLKICNIQSYFFLYQSELNCMPIKTMLPSTCYIVCTCIRHVHSSLILSHFIGKILVIACCVTKMENSVAPYQLASKLDCFQIQNRIYPC